MISNESSRRPGPYERLYHAVSPPEVLEQLTHEEVLAELAEMDIDVGPLTQQIEDMLRRVGANVREPHEFQAPGGGPIAETVRQIGARSPEDARRSLDGLLMLESTHPDSLYGYLAGVMNSPMPGGEKQRYVEALRLDPQEAVTLGFRNHPKLGNGFTAREMLSWIDESADIYPLVITPYRDIVIAAVNIPAVNRESFRSACLQVAADRFVIIISKSESRSVAEKGQLRDMVHELKQHLLPALASGGPSLPNDPINQGTQGQDLAHESCEVTSGKDPLEDVSQGTAGSTERLVMASVCRESKPMMNDATSNQPTSLSGPEEQAQRLNRRPERFAGTQVRLRAEEKELVAQWALNESELKTGCGVVLDAGSSTLALFKEFVARLHTRSTVVFVTFETNNLQVLTYYYKNVMDSQAQYAQIRLLGSILDADHLAVYGPEGVLRLRSGDFCPSNIYIGTSGIEFTESGKIRFSYHADPEEEFKKALFTCEAKERMILATPNKIGFTGGHFFDILDLKPANTAPIYLVTTSPDEKDEEEMQAFQNSWRVFNSRDMQKKIRDRGLTFQWVVLSRTDGQQIPNYPND